MATSAQDLLIEFLQTDLGLSAEVIAIATRKQETLISQIHITLWQYGLISLQQLNRIFDWLEHVGVAPDLG
ncbi:DUF2949 domain-containing protein [Synechococcales cyanobacterium C]|uniref:DUF2949 domain-containing protein n=1 Tax=Petrachloros mirabilis ULC683 TaxID=2781853 RepID=A0A8K2A7M4_9CYAN|nr:DUF2949 domain-containing protein [Petrachloros mirabilis]NCJ06110.1 DUF2949 domain-containing protein [Petrachloros mirabilis ULC683]